MKCNNCGHELDAKYIFCPKCGVKIDYEAEKTSEFDKFEDSPFKATYEKKNRKQSVLIGVLNFVVFALFFTNWFGVGFFDLFDGFGFNFFDVFRTVVDFSYMSGNVFKALFDIPFYMVLLVLLIAVFYIIGAVKLFQSSIRIFLKKTKKSCEVSALWCSLISGICAYLALLVFENDFDKGLNVKNFASNFIEVSLWYFLFIALIIGLLIATKNVLRDAKYDFTRKGMKAFDIVSTIYAVGIIIGFLVGIDVISLPQRLYKETPVYEEIDWNTGIAREVTINEKTGKEERYLPNGLYGEDFEYEDEDYYRSLIKEVEESRNRNAEYESNLQDESDEIIYDYPDSYKLDKADESGVISFEDAGFDYYNYYTFDYEFVPAGSPSWYVYDPVISERRFDFNVDTDYIDISDILALYPDLIDEGSYFYIEDGNTMYYSARYNDSMIMNSRDFISFFQLEDEDFRRVVKMFYKDYIDENGFIVIDENYSDTIEKTLVLSCEEDCLYSIVPYGVRRIGPYCYTNTRIGQIIVPDTCYQFDICAFKDCSELEAVVANEVDLIRGDCFLGTKINY